MFCEFKTREFERKFLASSPIWRRNVGLPQSRRKDQHIVQEDGLEQTLSNSWRLLLLLRSIASQNVVITIMQQNFNRHRCKRQPTSYLIP